MKKSEIVWQIIVLVVMLGTLIMGTIEMFQQDYAHAFLFYIIYVVILLSQVLNALKRIGDRLGVSINE